MSDRRSIIVLAEDARVLASVTASLREHGWHVLESRDPFEVMALVTKGHPAALLARTTAVTPEFLRQVRGSSPATRVYLAHPGGRLDDDLLRFADGWLAEPFVWAELAELLEETPSRSAPATDTPPDAEELKELVDVPTLLRVMEGCQQLAASELDRDDLVRQALELMMEVSASRRGSIMLVNADGNLDIALRRGFPEDDDIGDDQPRPAPVAEMVLARGLAMVGQLDARRSDPDRPHYRSHSFAVVPLLRGGTALGVANLTDRDGGEPYDQGDLLLLSLIADHMALALDNANRLADYAKLTLIDPLTDLYNRRHYEATVRREIAAARRYGRKLTLALIDIDRFKRINDGIGYKTGDEVIERVGHVLPECFREVDVVTRWGGDEFAVLLPDTRGHGTEVSYVERVLRAVAELDLGTLLPAGESITISVGLATFPDDCRDETGLFELADGALKAAKKAGGNRGFAARDLPAESDGEGDGESEAEGEGGA